MQTFYRDLANWWHLISSPEDYADEAAFFLQQLAHITARPGARLLELGSGGGNNALHMKYAFAHTTLSDLSPEMLTYSQRINPECEHIAGDMRSLRLGQTFDAVFIHDAIDYMTTLEDVRQAIQTTYIHCAPGGTALFVPDTTAETFEESTEHGGHDGEGRAVRYLEWTYDPDPTDKRYSTDYVFVLHENGQPVHTEHEQHTLGLFAEAEWLQLMRDAGFTPDTIEDDYGRTLFIGHRSST